MTHSTVSLKSPLMNKVVILSSFLIFFSFILIVTYAPATFANTETSSAVGTMQLNQDLFEVSTGSSELVKIFGSVPSANRGDRVAIIFTMPDGEEEGSLVFPTKDGFFESFLMLDNNSQLGTYTVFCSFNSTPMGTLTFSVTKNQLVIKDEPVPSLPTPKIFNEFTFTTNKNVYSDGEQIIISGHVDEIISQTPVTLKIISPNGNLITIDQIPVDGNGVFDTKIMSGGSTWASTGTYVINALYGINSKPIEVTFHFDATANTNTITKTSSSSINVEGHEVDFQMTDGNVINIIPDVNADSLTVSVDAPEDGSLTLAIPRSVLDATINGGDDEFFVLIDGEEVDFDETVTSTSRTLAIPFQAGSKVIEIIGTPTSNISTPPKITYYDTKLSLQLTDGTSQGYVKVKPTLTYGSGNALTSDVSIYVDGTYKTKVTSNQWSSNIYAGSGSHTIKASITELTSNTNTSIKYRASSDTENYLGKITSSQTSTQTSTQTPISNNDDFQMVYAIVIIAIIAVAAGVGITLSKRKKITPIISAQPAQVQTPSDETQFWVCPHCGSDTEYRNQKQFCSRCNIYL